MQVSIKRVCAAALAGSLIAASGAVLAQQTPRPAAPRPAQPAQPAQPAPAQPAAAPAGAEVVKLTPAQADWTKVCGKDQAANKEICYTTRDFGTAADQPPVLALAIYDVKGDPTKIVRLLLPPALLLRPGFRFSVDKGAALDGAFEICFPNGCFAEAKVPTATIDTVKKGTTLNVFVKNQFNAEVTFAIPLAGFGKSFDGAPIDPKVLEAQQNQLQEQMRQQAEEERKKLEGQQPGAAPAPAPTPAPR